MKKLAPWLVLATVGLLVVACGKKAEEAASETTTADIAPVEAGAPPPVPETVLPAEPSTAPAPPSGATTSEPGDTMGPPPSNPPPTLPKEPRT